MTCEEILDQAIAMLQRPGRMTSRTLQRQFALDEDALNNLKDERLSAHPEIQDASGRGLVWSGHASTAPPASSPPAHPLTLPSAPTAGHASTQSYGVPPTAPRQPH